MVWSVFALKKLLVLSLCILMFSLLAISPVKAIIPGPGTQVAIVPNPSSTHGGTLPSTDSAFDDFTFTNLPWANVTAGNLTSYQIVVLLIDGDAPTPMLTPSQVTDLNNWTYYGGKLILYDSEESTVDYSWLPYPFTTTNPGALGGITGSILYMENNTLGTDLSPASPYYINTTVDYIFNYWSDIIGDANVFATFDSHWCGDILAQNALFDEGWVHTYAVYGNGTMIYNGFDIDPLLATTVPGPEDINALAKIWLLELQQPWWEDYNLPCLRQAIPSVGGEILTTNTLEMLAPYILILASAIAATAGILYKKKTL
jgi:hypothetical protein